MGYLIYFFELNIVKAKIKFFKSFLDLLKFFGDSYNAKIN